MANRNVPWVSRHGLAFLDAIKVEPDSIKPLAVGKNCMLQAERLGGSPGASPTDPTEESQGKPEKKTGKSMGKATK
jgi:hypothetical protein